MTNSSERKTPKPNTSIPLGMKVGLRDTSTRGTKVTDNSQGWAAVANIPVPPTSELRSFQQPLKLAPVLINGGIIKPQEFEDEVVLKREIAAPVESNVLRGQSSKSEPKVNLKPRKLVEIDWYGAKLSLPCLNAIYQPSNSARGGQGWLMLELELDPVTGNPPWIPPVAQLAEDGRMLVPEFECSVDGTKVRCQILNIELYDWINRKCVIVLRVIH